MVDKSAWCPDVYTGTHPKENLGHEGALHCNGRKPGDCTIVSTLLHAHWLIPLHMIPNSDPIYTTVSYTTAKITLSQCLYDV